MFAGTSLGLRITKLKIPEHVAANQSVRLECDWDLDQETLYSVKWYKDGHEFYRYVPQEHPRVRILAVDGVTVNVSILFFPTFSNDFFFSSSEVFSYFKSYFTQL